VKACRGSRGIAPLILNDDNRWTLVVNCIPGRFTPGKETLTLCWRESPSGRFGEEKKISCHWRVGTLDCPGRSLFCVLAVLHRLPEILMYFVRTKVECNKIDYLKFYLFTYIKIS